METLKNLVADWDKARASVENDEGEVSTEIEIVIRELELKIPAKVDSIAYIMDRAAHTAQFNRDQAQMFTNEARKWENVVEFLKKYLKITMIERGLKELRGILSKFRLSPTSPSLVIYDESSIPARYFHEQTSLILDKASLKADLNTGVEIPGARLEGGVALRKTVNSRTREIE